MNKLKKTVSFATALVMFFFCLTLSACGGESDNTYPAKGVDLSSWQKEVNFSKLKEQGIDFVILRAGTSKGKDSNFEKFYREAKSAGLDIGCYFYTYALDNASAEEDAQMLLKWLKKKKLQLPVYYDVEDDSILSVSVSERTGICERFRKTMEEENYLVGLYANENWLTHHLDMSTLDGKYELWMAKWTNSGKDDADMSKFCRVWQYTDSGLLDGVSGGVDLDVCYFDYPSYIKSKGLNNYPETDAVTEALKIGEIWRTSNLEDTVFLTTPDGARIGNVDPNSDICVLTKKKVDGTLWGKTAVKGVKGWIKLDEATPSSKASVFISNACKCRIDDKNKTVYGLDGSVENMLESVYASNLFIKFCNNGDETKLGFVYDGYVFEEYLLSDQT